MRYMESQCRLPPLASIRIRSLIRSKPDNNGPWILIIRLFGWMLFTTRFVSSLITKAAGFNLEDRKEVLGLYLSESKDAHFWLGVLTDLQNRGAEDIFAAPVDGLTGFPEAIQTIFPNTEVQLCIVRQRRNSLRYVGSKYHKAFMVNIKRVYKALNKETAESALDELEQTWGDN